MSRLSSLARISKLLTPLLLIASAGAAQATNYYVGSLGSDVASAGSSPSNPYLTIQYGIDKAITGDTVFVLADTYTGNGNKDLDFGGKNLTLEALPYYGTATMVTIDCQNSGRAFYFHTGETKASVVDGFKMIHGKEDVTDVLTGYGGSVSIDNASPGFIDCTFDSNTGYSGGAIYTHSASPAFTGCTFTRNTAQADGGAIFVDSGSPTFTGCTFSKNFATSYGGAVYNYSASTTFTHCKFASNKAHYGGAIYLVQSSGVFNNDSFTSNSAIDGGAIFCYDHAYPTFFGGTISGNKASSRGGAVSDDTYANPTFYNTLITGNSAQYGSALYGFSHCNPGLYNVTITGNKAASDGGAIYNEFYSSPSVDWSILWNNKVGLANNEIVDTDSTCVSAVYDTDIEGGWSSGFFILDTDPKFVGTTDFHLKSTSPLIDLGIHAAYTVDDHDGNPRSCNNYTDLGAYERALPTADDDSYSISANTTLIVGKANGVLANDLANKGGTLSATLVGSPATGVLKFNSDGSFTYKPAVGFTGIQTFTYKAKNSMGYSSVMTVTIYVN